MARTEKEVDVRGLSYRYIDRPVTGQEQPSGYKVDQMTRRSKRRCDVNHVSENVRKLHWEGDREVAQL